MQKKLQPSQLKIQQKRLDRRLQFDNLIKKETTGLHILDIYSFLNL